MVWKILIACLMVVLAASATGYYLYFRSEPEELALPGTVETQEVRLSSRVGGRVSQVLVDEGDMVRAGQAIVELEMPELDSQRAQLEAQLQAAQAVLAKAEAGARPEEKAAAKAAVAAAQARLARMQSGFRKEEIEQALNEEQSLQAELQNAQQDLNRERSLLESRATTMARYDAAMARYSRLLAQTGGASAKLRMMEKGFRPEEIAEAAAELEQIQANYELLLAGTRQEEIDQAAAMVAQLKARIQELDIQRRERTVYAPEPAIIEVLAVRPGDYVAPNQPVARVLRAGDLWVKAYISEVDMGHVRVGQKVQVTMDTFPNKRFNGEIKYIASESEFTPRNVQTVDERRHQVFGLKVRVADPQGVFKSGMAATVHVPLRRPQQTTSNPPVKK